MSEDSIKYGRDDEECEEEGDLGTDYISVEEFLAEENRELRKAGCKLAIAALYVAHEFDGVHRLMLAVSEWTQTLANEGGRGKANRAITGK